jgi:hypothetical protein
MNTRTPTGHLTIVAAREFLKTNPTPQEMNDWANGEYGNVTLQARAMMFAACAAALAKVQS